MNNNSYSHAFLFSNTGSDCQGSIGTLLIKWLLQISKQIAESQNLNQDSQ